MSEIVWWTGLSALGLVVGLIGGMFGVGGGFLLTPLMNVLFGIPMNIAVGTGLCQMIGTAVSAFFRHRKLKQGEVKIDWIMMAGSLMGVQAGALTVASLSGMRNILFWNHSVPAIKFWLSLIYIVVLSAISFFMLYDARIRPAGAPLAPGPIARIALPPYTYLPNSERRVSVLVIAWIGLFLGYLSGLMGIGGGVVLMPILIYGIGMRIRMAAGTGILMLAFTSVAGTLAHARLGHVHLALAVVLLVGSTIGAPIGATLTHRLNGQFLRGLFAWLLMLTAVAVAWNLVW